MSNDTPTLLTVRDAAERLNVTPRTLKYYEERGLVTPTRSEGRYRLYDENDLDRFARILRLRSLGFSLEGITEMLKRPMQAVEGGRRFSDDSLREIGDALRAQVQALDARIDAMRREMKEAQTLKAELAHDLDYIERRLAGENAELLIRQRREETARKRALATKASQSARSTNAAPHEAASAPPSPARPQATAKRARKSAKNPDDPA
ncbi:MerR family transcriptional regulator [Paraburkholderia sp.]|uniref:MerR family transcriptional regulator n=1 Tax=Paraburkholderia sp. TaxID=1926495 RepID=UPI0023979B7A|nr:MerR family transcriptional regulator [Paraburkholderia sp.]MDE1184140.1 MerR family transcriptional regulator [Paraburkholderia sp.]